MKFNYYQITNLINGKAYIGITEETIEQRYKKHKQLLNRNVHPNYHLQPDWNIYGETNFQLNLIESKEYDNLEDGYYHEYELIQNSLLDLYNIQPGGVVNPIKNSESYQKMVQTKQSQVHDIYALEEIEENKFKIFKCFPSQKAAGREQAGWSQANISRALKGHYKAYDYFWVDETDIFNELSNWKPVRTKMRPVAKLDNENNIIEVHHNPRIFEKLYDYRPGVISASICHKNKCFGVKYQYISEEEYYKRVPITLVK